MGVMETTWKNMWDTRPVRLPRDQGGNAKIAGVCEGIGVRYQIDPTLIRILFVLLLFSGWGLALYLVAWLTMPKYSMRYSPWELVVQNTSSAGTVGATGQPMSDAEKQQKQTGWVLIAFLLFIAFTTAWGDVFRFASIAAIAIFGASWYLLHQRTPIPPVGLLFPTDREPGPHAEGFSTAADSSAPTVDLSSYSPVKGHATPVSGEQPPAWDPLGAAPFAWDLPDPAEQPQPKKKRRTPWVIGLVALLSAAAIGCASIVFALVGIAPWVTSESVGSVEMRPATSTELADEYTTDVGDISLDLRDLHKLDRDREVVVQSTIGDIDVRLPDDIRTTVTCKNKVGSSSCPSDTVNDQADGSTLRLVVINDIGDISVS
ncbi:PspC domain-containing protein [Corynebacterium diphtheriae]|uniref:PspC domain-containing protein n=1 Tax=Corynebacterium diphtheriae TaxID=1717 RepID=UPI0015F6000C|nr:PspC domain-containing protein [Corynebacterium diphtheriae]MBG9341999.1 PspC domain-containing protein [Corynebacterium diphtheriae]